MSQAASAHSGQSLLPLRAAVGDSILTMGRMALDPPILTLGGVCLAGVLVGLPCTIFTPVGVHWLLAWFTLFVVFIASAAAIYGAWKKVAEA